MIELFTRPGCGYCLRAVALLRARGLAFVEYDLSLSPAAGAEMRRRVPAARTVPQIFIGGTPVGGFDDLAQMDRSGRLAERIAAGCRAAPVREQRT